MKNWFLYLSIVSVSACTLSVLVGWVSYYARSIFVAYFLARMFRFLSLVGVSSGAMAVFGTMALSSWNSG